MEGRKDRHPWYPRIESSPLFVTSAEYERGLGHEDGGREFDLAEEDAGMPADEELPEEPCQPSAEAGRSAE